MLDFVLGAALAGMLVRGWLRGMVREVLDLVGLVVGIWAAFRLSAPLGDFLGGAFGMRPETARIAGGIALFILLGVLLSIAAALLTRAMNLPGLSLVNRAGGALVAIAWGTLVLLVLVGLARVMPLPGAWKAELGSSRVVDLVAGDDAFPRQLFESIAGDDVMAAVSAIEEVFGTARAVPVGDQVLEIPPASPEETRTLPEEAVRALQRLNQHRVGLGVGALAEVGFLTDLAEDHAFEQYHQGRLSRLRDCAAILAARGHQVLSCDNAVALAATSHAALDALLDTPETEGILAGSTFDRAGIAVVDGPTGRLMVVVLGG